MESELPSITKNTESELDFFIPLAILCFYLYRYLDFNTLFSEVTNSKSNLVSIGLVLAWLAYMYWDTNFGQPDGANRERKIESTKKALLAIVIAFFASLDLIVAPFWTVWLLAYFFRDWI